jgi:hypothetical protein
MLKKARYADWYFEASPKGWKNDGIAVRWLKGVFIPLTKPENSEEWRLLILDGHKSHITPLFMAECLSHKIWVVFLPANTSHVLQPCDLGFFSRMKPAYRHKLSMACALNAYDDPKKPEFLAACSRAREIATTPGNVLLGWKAPGIFPRDRKKALNNRYVRSNNQVRKTPKSQMALNPVLHNFDIGLSLIEFATPKSSRDILKLAQQTRDVDTIFGTPLPGNYSERSAKDLISTSSKTPPPKLAMTSCKRPWIE